MRSPWSFLLTFFLFTDALSKDELIHALHLPKVNDREWICFETSAQTGKTLESIWKNEMSRTQLGSGVMEMFSYLAEFVHRRR